MPVPFGVLASFNSRFGILDLFSVELCTLYMDHCLILKPFPKLESLLSKRVVHVLLTSFFTSMLDDSSPIYHMLLAKHDISNISQLTFVKSLKRLNSK